MTIQELPEHNRVYNHLLSFFKNKKEVIGIFISGSLAKKTMDQYSDIDIGIVFDNEDNRLLNWEKRWEWNIPSWFHRFDADHIKNYFIIYFFDTEIKADICLYTLNDLPSKHGAPFEIVYDKHNQLSNWCFEKNEKMKEMKTTIKNDKDEIIHNDERFWAWLFYCYQHIARGEYYTIASDFFMLRNIIENWYSILNNRYAFSTRFAEKNYDSTIMNNLSNLFPSPNKDSLIKSCLILIDIEIELKRTLTERFNIIWKTTDDAINKITELYKNPNW